MPPRVLHLAPITKPPDTVRWNLASRWSGYDAAPLRTGSGPGVNGKMGICWSDLLPFGIYLIDSRPYGRRSPGVGFFFRKNGVYSV